MKLINSTQLSAELTGFGFRTVEFRDVLYYCPEFSWLEKFDEYLQPLLAPLRDAVKAGFKCVDCDDFAMRVVDRALDCLLAGDNDKPVCGHSVGLADVIIRNFDDDGNVSVGLNGITGSHETNIIRCADDWYFYEPQTRKHCKVKDALGVISILAWCRM
jgi:hypothetical protein